MADHWVFGTLGSRFDSAYPHNSPERIEYMLEKYRNGWVGPCSNCIHFDGSSECNFWKRKKSPNGGCPVKSIAFNRLDKSKEIQFWG